MPQTSDQNNNPIDLRELANLINDRFTQIDARFDKIDDKFAQIDARFDKIDDKFVQIDARFAQIDARFNKVDARFAKMDQANCELLEFLGEQFDKMNAKIDTKADKADTATKEDINLVLNRIAMTNTKTDDYRAEQINMQRQVDKHERWHFQVAEKTGVKLSSD
jgi:chromosome segregation ATPase